MSNDRERELPRRSFIRSGLGMGVLAALSSGVSCGKDPPGKDYETYIKDKDLTGPEPLPPTRVYPPMDRATVGIAGVRDSLEQAVSEAVEAAGGLAEIEKGQRVFIKPCMVGPALRSLYPGRITTNPEVLRAVIRLVQRRGARAIVGDRGTFPELAFKTTGLAKVCREEGAEAYLFPFSGFEWFKPNRRHWSRGFRMPTILKKVDHFINLPILKNHEASNAEFSCCLKSFVGVCHPEDRWQAGADGLHARNISEKIAELNLCAQPTINIVDATTIMVRGGPGSGIVWGDPLNRVAIWENPHLILASRDRVACDSLALAVLKLYGADHKVKRSYIDKSVWNQTQIYYAAELGLGQAEPDKIAIADVQVPRFDEIKSNWK
jgi:uncharacterized protein (DUF362 family)